MRESLQRSRGRPGKDVPQWPSMYVRVFQPSELGWYCTGMAEDSGLQAVLKLELGTSLEILKPAPIKRLFPLAPRTLW